MIIDFKGKYAMRLPTNRPPVHPGEILREEFMKPLDMTQSELSRRISIPRNHISNVLNCKKGITPDLALRLSKLFGTSPELWLNGQTAWDLWHLTRGESAYELEAIEPVLFA